ncbi:MULTISPECIES: GumC family protein [Gluconobacter]|uniref:Polysaccharide biosynthesis tyrosine autokinase n=1 Tax=Gluconobacter cadivus TaxID=2728101 RepID=A0ABR9YVX7_9PROT|nr:MULTISPECIES: polysaccharide biosynthesis tyrosine autokinase [Gluconobacter]MBF0888685.1 polysaccharide biosynthesis tyrosine autokinase [Gluconobacter cadivus]MBS1059976.1 polysaccharide biosynthesis tyrosine autokinase [Gluconobacter sp. Dm-44]
MSQISGAMPPQQYSPMDIGPAPEQEFAGFGRIFSILRQHKLLMCSVAGGTFLLGAAAIATLKPYYESVAEIAIGARGMISPSELSPYADRALDLVALNTQIDILKSPTIALMVTQRLHLADTPEYVKALNPSFVSQLKKKLGLQKASPPLTPQQRNEVVSGLLMGKVHISNDGRSAIIGITARSAGPDLAPAIANGYVKAYLDFEQQAKIQAARNASLLLEEQIAPLRQRSIQAEQELSRYRQEHNLYLLGDDSGGDSGRTARIALPATPNDLHLTQMNHELGEAEADLASKQAIYHEAASSGNVGTITAITASPLIQGLRLQQTQINARISTLASTALEQNPELVAARAQAARIDAQIAAESQKLLQNLRYEADAAQQRVNALKERTNALQANVTEEEHADIRLRQLVGEATAAQTLYRDYLSRLGQVSAETTIQQAEARLITPANQPLGPAGPPKKQYGILLFLVSLGLGAGAALLRDRSRSSLRTLAELEQQTRLFGLGALPRFRGSLREQLTSGDSLYGRMLNSMRAILTFGNPSIRTKITVITSAESGEGKTTLAISLAASIGALGKRALLIDCDAHRPSVLRALDLRAHEEGFIHDALPGLDIFVASQTGEPGVLNFGALGEFLEKHRGEYDQIIIDTPPILSFPEAGVLASFAEGVIIAVKWHQTSASAVIETQRILRTHHANCLGAVLTFVDIENLRPEESLRMGDYSHYRKLVSSS